MKTYLTTLILIVSTAMVMAQTNGAAAKPQKREVTPEMRQKILERTGGVVTSEPQGPVVALLNAQKRVANDTLLELSQEMQRFVQLPASFRESHSDSPIALAQEALKDKGTAVVIVVGDSSGYPTLLVAPESRWALVNVAALAADNSDAEKLTARVKKEIWRAYGYLMGAANSNFEHCLMKSVCSLEDLDALSGKCISPEPFPFFYEYARKLGMTQIRTTTYRNAVQQGWAAAPTNDYQKAIWEALKGKAEKR